jgi:hypothetical protein
VFLIGKKVDPHGKAAGTPGIYRIYEYAFLTPAMVFYRGNHIIH